ncbi:ribonuclease P protein component RnpA [Gottschalkia acidurici 9a]|uniref:Ribonuclease P protein component n=1 Tax=Gottschalkia acidurici (strain ATCC 7906 / DSM 604 / BCRC 14475 / CIP 104303 / KCTC 5404 / NCIMB 10678 / 9a) TaxID=1128398 RepID=K0B1R6_GOTA9|nr:ribonuclease P protein component [Gottschalkia acidurici]AFS79923.1 ribonuclease P protein component RnpA [Gottschalkia acidurici 9a]
MNKDQTLRNNKEFRYVYDKGKSFANKYIVMFFIKNELGFNRVGFSTTKKLGNSVVRNKFKRRMKESYRLNKDKFKQGYDIVFLSRPSAKDIDYKSIESAILHLGKISKLLIKG